MTMPFEERFDGAAEFHSLFCFLSQTTEQGEGLVVCSYRRKYLEQRLKAMPDL